MNMNLASLRITANKEFVRLHPISHDMIERARKEDREASARYLVFTRQEASLAIDCLRGNAPYAPFFDDGIHLIKFHTRGFREVYLSSYVGGKGGAYEDYWFNVPGEWLAQKLETALMVIAQKVHNGLEPEYSYTATNGELCDVANACAPRIIWRYGENVQSRVVSDLDCPKQEGLQRCLDGLKAIAENHSDGTPSVINLRFDSYGTSEKPVMDYYFSITNGERSIIHGGIIAHKVSDGSYKYSTHT